MKKLTFVMSAALLLGACKEQAKPKMTSTHAAAVVFVVGSDAKIVTAKGQTKAVKGSLLYEGDTVQTGVKSQVDLLLPGKIMVRIDQNTTVSMRQFAAADGAQSDKLYLQRGLVFAKVTKLGAHSAFAIQTPTIVAGVRGTEFMTTSDEKGAGKVAVTEGNVAVASGSGTEQDVAAGEQAQVSENGSVAETKLDDATAAQMKTLATVGDIKEAELQNFENILNQQKEALKNAGGTDKIQSIKEENDKKMQEKRDEGTKRVEDQKGQTDTKIQEMNKGTTDKIEQMKNSVEEQKKKREELFKKFPQK